MERLPNLQPNESQLRAAFELVDHDTIIQFVDDTVRVFGIIETGEIDTRTIKTGESEYVFRVPSREPLLRETINLFGLTPAVTETTDQSYGPDIVSSVIPGTEAAAWRQDFHEPETIVAAARKRIESNQPELDTLPCGNCKGAQTFHIDCSCTDGGIIFLDEDGTQTSLREKGEADPDCDRCQGGGAYDNPCPVCDGCGTTPRKPYVKLINEQTDVSQEVVIDAVRLIADHELIIEKSGYEFVERNGWERGEWRLILQLGKFITQRFVALGVDTEKALFVTPFGAREHYVSDPWAESHYYSRRAGDEEAQTGDRNHHPDRASYTPDYILTLFENAVARTFRPLPNQHVGQGEPFPYPLRPLPDLAKAFFELKSLLETNGYTLGYKHGFVGTGETGPSFLAMNEEGTSGEELSSSYTVEAALDNALERARAIFGSTK